MDLFLAVPSVRRVDLAVMNVVHDHETGNEYDDCQHSLFVT